MNRAASFFIITILFTIIFTGCNTSISVKTQPDMSSNFIMQTKVTQSVQSVLETFFGANSDSGSLFDEKEIRNSLERSKFDVLNIQTPTKTSLKVTAKTNDIRTSIPGTTDFITTKKENGKSTMSINLTPKNIQKAVKILPSETSMYIDLLIAPVFTGEEMSKEEYIDLIAIAYGDDMADDLKKASISVSFSVPGTITETNLSNKDFCSITPGKSNFVLKIPLLNLLTDLEGTNCTICYQE